MAVVLWNVLVGIAAGAAFAIMSKLTTNLQGWHWWAATTLFAVVCMGIAAAFPLPSKVARALGSRNRAGGSVDIKIRGVNPSESHQILSDNAAKGDIKIDLDSK